jgi:hypothetical protein
MMNFTAMQAQLRAIRAENEESITLRRGDITLAAQDMRIEYAGRQSARMQSDAARQAQQAVVILGEPDMDIAVEDRLTYDGRRIKVVFVQPNRLAATIAEGVVEE